MLVGLVFVGLSALCVCTRRAPVSTVKCVSRPSLSVIYPDQPKNKINHLLLCYNYATHILTTNPFVTLWHNLT